MRALVIGGTGKVGRNVVAALGSEQVEAVVAARNPGPGGVALDLRDVGAVEQVARGFDVAFLATPLGHDEAEVGVAAVAALRRAGVGKIVYLGIMNLEAMREIPHFETKIPVRDAVLADGRGVMIAANFFFQNDALMLPAIRFDGVYPMPVGSAGVFSVDVADIGRAAARVMVRDDWNGSAVPLCGRERLTGASMATTWSAALGRPVVYPGDDLGPFLAALSQQIPGWNDWIADDFRLMMKVTQRHGCPASDADIAASTAIIGRPPRLYAEFVTELARLPLQPPPGEQIS